jgi:hypothetical protein
MLDKKIKIISLLILSLLYTLSNSILRSDNLNECIKRAVSKEISLNKILTLCRENINPINVYSNNYEVNKRDPGSEYISTNKTDKIINELIEEGNLSKAGRLAIRQEEEKTKRIKARAEAEALRSPQIIATQQESTKSNTNNNIRSTMSLGANPITSTSAGSKVLQITTPGVHGAIPGQFVQISNVDNSIDGIAASEINKFHVISSVPSTTTFTISVLSSAINGSVAGGGAEVLAIFQN